VPQDTQTSYDAVADIYDRFYKTPDCLAENWAVKQMLSGAVNQLPDSIIDIGAGTGMFLDLFPWAVDLTVNIDPSQAMLDRLQRKHRQAKVLMGDHTAVNELPAAGLVVSLFQSPSHLPKEQVADCLARATRRDGSVFAMFAAPGEEQSLVLKHAGIDSPLTAWSIEEVQGLADRLEAAQSFVFSLNRYVCMFAMEVVGG